MAHTSENIPVFRSSNRYDRPEDLIGRATVEVDEENNRSRIVIETVGNAFTEFVLMGELKALSLSGMVTKVDPEKAKEYWSRQR